MYSSKSYSVQKHDLQTSKGRTIRRQLRMARCIYIFRLVGRHKWSQRPIVILSDHIHISSGMAAWIRALHLIVLLHVRTEITKLTSSRSWSALKWPLPIPTGHLRFIKGIVHTCRRSRLNDFSCYPCNRRAETDSIDALQLCIRHNARQLLYAPLSSNGNTLTLPRIANPTDADDTRLVFLKSTNILHLNDASLASYGSTFKQIQIINRSDVFAGFASRYIIAIALDFASPHVTLQGYNNVCRKLESWLHSR